MSKKKTNKKPLPPQRWEVKTDLNDFPRQRLVALARHHGVTRRVLASHLLEWAVCQLDTGKLELRAFALSEGGDQ